MILSAIYIEEHFLIDNPAVINFGGKFVYTLNDRTISKEENEDYVVNFYSKETIRLLSAVVGRNGAGKSSLLDLLINVINKQYGYISALVFEDGDKILVKQRSNIMFDFEYEIFHAESTTFYYSPYLDFKLDRGGFDLSLDQTIDNDLDKIDSIRKSSDKVNPIQHLKMKTWIRQMEFINSDLGQEFAKFFGLPTDGLNKITFTRHMIDVDYEKDEIQFHNTPYGFRSVLQFIYDKVRLEAKKINEDRPEVFSLVLLQKNMLKNYFLMDFICLFIIQMEKQNTYLSEGFLKIDPNTFQSKHKNTNSLLAFFDFLENHYYRIGGKEFTLLPISETKKLIEEVFNYIDLTEAEDDHDNRFFDWNEKAIYLDQEKAIALLNLQNEFLDKVDTYYKKSGDTLLDLKFFNRSRINDFINFQPSGRSLSSGENALLNLFSRFHEVFDKELSTIPKGNLNPLNFVLLDEADLGFHPQWKKQFVKFILLFFESYFNKLGTKVQIIFTTHDALTLSDILNSNVIYLDKTKSSFAFDNDSKPRVSFGANISDLISDSFFVDDGLIGEFAKGKIQDVIEYINDSAIRQQIEWITEPIVAKKVIEQIGEPYLSEKLNDMFLEAFPQFKKDEIKRLEEKLKHLRNDSNSSK